MALVRKKIMMLGTLAVGKTSISRRFAFGTFDQNYKSTIGVDIYEQDLELAAGQKMRFMIWDAEGNFLDDGVKPVYVKGASGGIMVGDMSRPQTFDHMKRYAQIFKNLLPGRPLIHVLNKADLVTQEACMAMKKDLEERMGDEVWVTSATENLNIQNLFIALADKLEKSDL